MLQETVPGHVHGAPGVDSEFGTYGTHAGVQGTILGRVQPKSGERDRSSSSSASSEILGSSIDNGMVVEGHQGDEVSVDLGAGSRHSSTSSIGRNLEHVAFLDVPISYKYNCCCIGWLPGWCTESCPKQPAEIGNSILLCGPGLGTMFPKTCLLGPDWMCAWFTLALIIVPTIMWIVSIAVPLGPGYVVAGTLTCTLTLGNYSVAAFSDPGIVPKRETLPPPEEAPSGRFVTQCSICNVYRQRGTNHCYSCGVCVEGLDHHCPWVNRCIGKKTIKYFHRFLFWIGVHAVLLLAILLLSAAPNRKGTNNSGGGTL